MQIFNHNSPPLTLADKTKENLFGKLLNYSVMSQLSSLDCPLYLNHDSSKMFDIMKSKDIRFQDPGLISIEFRLLNFFHSDVNTKTKRNFQSKRTSYRHSTEIWQRVESIATKSFVALTSHFSYCKERFCFLNRRRKPSY